MNTRVILVEFAIVIHQVLCENSISVSDNLRKKIALEVLKVSPVSTVVSPFALSLPLCKLASAARGHAKVELMSALGIPTESELKNCYDSVVAEISEMRRIDLMLTSVIYLNESLDVDPGFRNNSKHYGVRIDKVGFRFPKAAAKYMNRWVGWEMPFDVRFTKPKKFYVQNRLWTLPMMCKIDTFIYLDDVNNNFKALHINMRTPGLSITFFLPETKTGLPDLFKKFYDDHQMIKRTMDRMQPKMLMVCLPRMKIKTYVDWTGFLKLIGVNDVFSANSSGLEGILKNSSHDHVYLSKAKQKVFMEMDEMGVTMGQKQKDAASRERTAREFIHFSDNVEPLEFEHPFLFLVSLAAGGTHHQMLMGAFYGPQEEFM